MRKNELIIGYEKCSDCGGKNQVGSLDQENMRSVCLGPGAARVGKRRAMQVSLG